MMVGCGQQYAPGTQAAINPLLPGAKPSSNGVTFELFADGSLLAEYAKERRLYLPIQAIPKSVINAFIAAEDKSFYEHNGIDFSGIARATMSYVQNYGRGRRPQGASTITQQVAKNFLLTNELSLERKIKEAMLALKIERTYSKDKILEL